jgi:hypothetical protein
MDDWKNALFQPPFHQKWCGEPTVSAFRRYADTAPWGLRLRRAVLSAFPSAPSLVLLRPELTA